MRVPFSDDSFVPIDRPYTHLLNKKIFPFLTLGACSYAIDSVVEWNKTAHVLIGRFCSIARDTSFLLGLNHNYKNVVTTYPFDVDFVMKKICAGAKITAPNYEPEERRCDNHYQIIVGNDVWIGQGATIIGGVWIGDGAIIGTNTMVTKNVPPYAVVVGNPARIVKYRFDVETIKKFMAVKWWNWSIKKIYKNLPLIYDTEKFLAKHYAPEIETAVDSEIIAKRKAGWKIYALVADFGAKIPLWKKIIAEFNRADLENALLMILPDKKFRAKDLKALNEFLGENILKLDFTPQNLKQATHFITTREMVTLECLSHLYDTDVKIISALEDKIFYW